MQASLSLLVSFIHLTNSLGSDNSNDEFADADGAVGTVTGAGVGVGLDLKRLNAKLCPAPNPNPCTTLEKNPGCSTLTLCCCTADDNGAEGVTGADDLLNDLDGLEKDDLDDLEELEKDDRPGISNYRYNKYFKLIFFF